MSVRRLWMKVEGGRCERRWWTAAAWSGSGRCQSRNTCSDGDEFCVEEVAWCGVDGDSQVEALSPGGCCPSGLTTDKDCTARVI